ncbi:hypothetical protein M0R89_21760 (plasmid) [Halorussus limi]|uniref:Uncharacterized protein n=3 Tax=Halobacteriales TaxID=2235 RepID=A0A8U0I2A4_9EURY|nr:hypothetical protein [Halorussus limi]UPV77046.1 hypothetical protein M0R89_21760 [Halorussus limi]
MSYTKTGGSSRGDTNKDHTMRIKVMKAKVPSTSELDTVYQAVLNALDQIMDETGSAYGMDIPGYVIEKYETDHSLNCSNMESSATTWLDNNGFTDGQFLWVTNCSDAFADSEGAWEGRTEAFVSTDWYSGDMLGAVAIQEALHSFLLDSCLKLPGDDHSLGQDADEGSYDNATPMVASYGDSSENYESKGDCNRDKNTDGVTYDITYCTVEGMNYSREHAYNNGVH